MSKTAPADRPIPEPQDVVDGIADRTRRGVVWKTIVIAIIFLAWVGFLVYCLVAG